MATTVLISALWAGRLLNFCAEGCAYSGQGWYSASGLNDGPCQYKKSRPVAAIEPQNTADGHL